MASTLTWFDIPATRGIVTNTDTASTTLVGADSGKMYMHTYTTNGTYTLPALTGGIGKVFFFNNANTTSTIAITAPSACMFANDATGTTNTCSAVSGSWCMVTCDGTNYYCFEGYGTWTLT
jgi:hypothetical protein